MVKEAMFFEKTGSSPITAPLTVTLSPGAAFLASETTRARGRPTIFSANLTAIFWVTFWSEVRAFTVSLGLQPIRETAAIVRMIKCVVRMETPFY